MAKKFKAKKIRQKSLTLNDLAKYNQEVLFSALDHNFAKINKKFTKIDDKFTKIDETFIKIDQRFDEMDKRFDGIDKEIKEKFDKVLDGQDKLMKSIENLKSDNTASSEAYKRQDKKLDNHETRIVAMEQKVGIAA